MSCQLVLPGPRSATRMKCVRSVDRSMAKPVRFAAELLHSSATLVGDAAVAFTVAGAGGAVTADGRLGAELHPATAAAATTM